MSHRSTARLAHGLVPVAAPLPGGPGSVVGTLLSSCQHLLQSHCAAILVVLREGTAGHLWRGLLIAQRGWRSTRLAHRCDAAPLPGMRHTVLGARAFLNG